MIIFKNRPQIDLPWVFNEKLFLWLGISLFLTSLCYLGFIWGDLPATIPINFDSQGNASSWGEKHYLIYLSLLILIAVSSLIFASFKPHLSNIPWQVTEENAGVFYGLIRLFSLRLQLQIAAFFLYVLWGIAQVAQKKAVGMDPYGMYIFLFLFFWTIIRFFRQGSRIKEYFN